MSMTGSAATNSAFDSDAIGLIREEGILDNWTFFDYKKVFNNALGTTAKWIPSWVGDHRRRIRSYIILESYYKQCARRQVLESPTEDTGERREYGDAYVIVETTLASLLGNDQSFIVEGAVSEEEGSPQNVQQDLIAEWADQENFHLHLSECERNCVKLGDGVYTLGWNSKKKRPVLRVWDPGFYFPVEDPLNDEEFPKKCHIAYEFEQEDANKNKQKFVRKITWEMKPARQNLPWNEDPAEETCWFQDGVWELKGQKTAGLDDLGDGAARWRTPPTDLGIDFMPVVHIPSMNFDSIEGWGTSVIAPVLQLLDDVHVNDTDLANAARLTAWPIIGVADGRLERDDWGKVVSYGPGTTIEGKIDIPDTSKNLDALLKFEDQRLSRLAVNSRVPETILGRVDPGKVQSGVILTISLAPHTTLIREMRRIRKAKYRLLLKFVMRFLWKESPGDFKEIFTTDLQFGSYLPADKQEVSGIVTAVLNAHGMSRETGVRMLVDAGYPIDDIAAEIERIQSIDFDGAAKITDATGDFDAAREYLGLEGPTPPGVTPEDEQEHEVELQESQQDFGREQFMAQQKLSNDQAQQRQPTP